MCITSEKIGSIARKTHTLRLQGSINVLTALEIMDMYDAEIAGIECENSFVGIFCRRNFAKNIARDRLDPENTTLYEVMALNAPSIAHDTTIKDTYEKMLADHSDYMAVLEEDGRTLSGIVFLSDLGNDVIQSFEKIRAENEIIMDYIRGGESYAIATYKRS
jgi:CBS domain-containing protein